MNKKLLVKTGLGFMALVGMCNIAYAADGVISIDAGHGHNTSGKRNPEDLFREWDINDAVADKLEVLLENEGYTVHRLDDVTGQTDVSLNTRLARAKELGSELHISLHQNALYDYQYSDAEGTESYYSVLGSAKSQALAKDIATRMANYIGTVNRGAKGTTNELFITREFTKAGIDAVLVEGLFMDNYEDSRYMMTEEYATEYAQAIFDSVVSTYGDKVVSSGQVKTNVNIIKTSIKAGDFVRVKEIGETLNIRRYPGAQSEVVGEVQPGESFTVVAVNDSGWGLLKSYEEGRDGWVKLSDKYVEVVK